MPLRRLHRPESAKSPIPPGFAARQLCYVPGSGLIYLQNPKVCCTSIRESLWRRADVLSGRKTYAGNPYLAKDSPFCRGLASIEASGLDAFLASSVFSVVRNPYSRVLSAYLDKVASPARDGRVWRPFAARYGWNTDGVPTLADVLAALAGDDALAVDQHFRPQYLNLLHPWAGPGFVGRLERMDEVDTYLRERRVALGHAASHGKNAAEKLAAYFGPAEAKLAATIYAQDFEIYGYSLDLNAPAPSVAVACEAPEPRALRAFFLSQRDAVVAKRGSRKPIIRPPYWKVPWRVMKRTGVARPPPARTKREGEAD